MKVLIGSKSNLKKDAIENILNKYSDKLNFKEKIEVINNEVNSEVPETPYNEQAFVGAKNRAEFLYRNNKEKENICVGIESSIAERVGLLFEECWCVIYSFSGKIYTGYSSGFMIPEDISIRMRNGESHIKVMNEKGKKLSTSSKNTWSIYSSDLIKREESVEESFRNALFAYYNSEKV